MAIHRRTDNKFDYKYATQR